MSHVTSRLLLTAKLAAGALAPAVAVAVAPAALADGRTQIDDQRAEALYVGQDLHALLLDLQSDSLYYASYARGVQRYDLEHLASSAGNLAAKFRAMVLTALRQGKSNYVVLALLDRLDTEYRFLDEDAAELWYLPYVLEDELAEVHRLTEELKLVLSDDHGHGGVVIGGGGRDEGSVGHGGGRDDDGGDAGQGGGRDDGGVGQGGGRDGNGGGIITR